MLSSTAPASSLSLVQFPLVLALSIRIIIQRHTHQSPMMSVILPDNLFTAQLPQPRIMVTARRDQVRAVSTERAIPHPTLMAKQCRLERKRVFAVELLLGVERPHGHEHVGSIGRRGWWHPKSGAGGVGVRRWGGAGWLTGRGVRGVSMLQGVGGEGVEVGICCCSLEWSKR